MIGHEFEDYDQAGCDGQVLDQRELRRRQVIFICGGAVSATVLAIVLVIVVYLG